MKLLALGKKGFDRDCADGAAQVAQHVEQPRCGTGLGRRDADHGDGGQRCHRQCLTERPRHIRNKKLRGSVVWVEVQVHKATCGEDRKADTHQKARIEPGISSGTKGITSSCGYPVQAMTSPLCCASNPCETARYCGSR